MPHSSGYGSGSTTMVTVGQKQEAQKRKKRKQHTHSAAVTAGRVLPDASDIGVGIVIGQMS